MTLAETDATATAHRSGAPGRRRRSRRRAGLAVVGALAVLATACSSEDVSDTTGGTGTGGTSATADDGTASGTSPGPALDTSRAYLVFGAQGNHLEAYAPAPPFTAQRVITAAAEDPDGLDINGQICFVGDGRTFIAGEDTGQSGGEVQGWGVFRLEGDAIGDLRATEVGKLVPTFQDVEEQPENYGCGELADGRLLTTDIGLQALGPASGQLIVWFPPFDTFEVAYCKLDVDIATAQSIWVDDQDRIWVASARPSDEAGATSGGVWVYEGPFPTGPDAAGGCGRTDDTGAPLADVVNKRLVIPAGANGLLSPAGLAPAPNGNLYVSSVASGVINEYTTEGDFVRSILAPDEGETIGSYAGGTPLGLGTGPDGTLYYADIGLVVRPNGLPGPGAGTGTVRRIVFVDGEPQAPEVMAGGLAFPDGIGIWLLP